MNGHNIYGRYADNNIQIYCYTSQERRDMYIGVRLRMWLIGKWHSVATKRISKLALRRDE